MKRRLLASILIVCGIVLLFVTTNPEHLPAAVFIGFFILFYVLCYSLLSLAGMLLCRLEILRWDKKRVNRTAYAVACLPVFLLVLQSIGQLTLKDILLSIGLFALLYLYFGRALLKGTSD